MSFSIYPQVLVLLHPVCLTSNRKYNTNMTLENYANIATIVGGLAIFGVLAQLLYQRQHHKKEWSILYIEKYSDNELAECGQKTREFLENKNNIKNKTQAFKDRKKDADLSRSISIYLNFFEALAYLYMNNIVDRDMIINMLGSVSLTMHDIATWYIDMVQDEIKTKNLPRIELPYSEWGKMNEMMIASKRQKTKLPWRPAP